MNNKKTNTKYSICLVLLSMALSACNTYQQAKPLPIQKLTELKSRSLSPILPIPVQGVERYNLTDTWGVARSHGRTHEGIDIIAPRGTPVTSTTDGIVASLKPNKLGGTVIWIVGPAGAWHYYAHLNKHERGLHVGQVVKAGQKIGYVGNTGNAAKTVTHLHYGIYLNGKGRGATNPYPYLRGQI